MDSNLTQRSTNYQAQHDRQGVQKKGLLKDALLAQNKSLTQQIEQLTAQMAKLPQQLHVLLHLKAGVNQLGVIFVEVIILLVTILIRTIPLKLR